MLSRFMDHGSFDCFLLAGRYSLLDRSAEAEFLPKVIKAGIGLILGGVFNSGILADPTVADPRYNYAPAPQDIIDRALKLKAICDSHGVPLKAAALQFPLRHKAVTTILTGVHKAAEWQENSALMAFPIPPALWDDVA